MKIRTITAGFNLKYPLKEKQFKDIADFTSKAKKEFEKRNVQVQTLRFSTQPWEEYFKSKLATAAYPDPELLIRTSGEHRISNFLLWELAYTELYFCEKMWPDFEKEDLYSAISDFQNRERRFGKTSEQIKF